ncbi:PAS domain-containing protein [Oscillochloris sp. ZM17-4]|uniref:CheR family methyltransferase n=1 Tax=Oscillochloris sp. ZM17-4 TaxID=2866714 RepID=UPI001C73284D|nr:CheR family methyltransferase [Oscillochloris sp. ZM17-4]MBX0328981.1 PAS domain-containing protein [Oscillochloris sp. ZM17-4]
MSGDVGDSQDIALMAPPMMGAAPPHDQSAPESDALGAIIAILGQRAGHDFSHAMPLTLRRRVDRRMRLSHLRSLEAYLARIQENHAEADLLLRDLLVGAAEFFRDPAAFDALAATAIPSLLRSKGGGVPLRIWVPGCASGEEAYSIAIMIHEQLSQLDVALPVQLFVTDIDEAALAAARRGRYDAGIAAHVSPERLARYFVQEHEGYRVSAPIRELCLFSAHNLVSDPPFGRMDLIVCRDLLISFDAEITRQIMPMLHYALAPGGYLFLGTAEGVDSTDGIGELFWVVDAPHRIYQRKERLVRQPSALPWAVTRRPPAGLAGGGGRSMAPGALDIGATLEQILLRDFTPAAAIINALGTVAYMTGNLHPFLKVPAGEPMINILAMAHPDLHLPLRVAIRTVVQEQVQVVRDDLEIVTDDGVQRLSLTVRPLVEPGVDAGLMLVAIQVLGPPASLGPRRVGEREAGDPTDPVAQELQRTRDTLEATISELQEANLDLKMVNEELRSLNEELQAANEELQTSKEEIQSINEELQTVNVELSRKIEELDRANADLANFFASTQIPAIFLHIDGRIARFTPQATELFALIESDVGRPITDLNARFSDGDLHAMIAQVIQTLAPAEMVVRQPDHKRWWNVHISPYRTLAGVIDGVMITFSDISTLKRTEAVLQEAHDELERRVEARTRDLALANTAIQAQVEERIRSEHAREKLLQQIVTAQEEERRHIARELHDEMGQDLTALILGLKALQDVVKVDPRSVDRIVQMQVMAMRISQKIRALAVQLRPSVIDDLGLLLALSNYMEQWSVQANVAVDLHSSGLDGVRLPLAMETTIYRMVQEALTNVLKHAHASEVSVIIERHSGEVRVIIEDDGAGFVVSAPSGGGASAQHLGLIGMRERVDLLGGTLTVESAPGSGTTIFARIPLPEGAQGDGHVANDNLSGR